MQTKDMVEKKKVLIDNVEIPGLVSFGESGIEDGEVEVPGFDRIVTIANGTGKVLPVDAIYKVRRDSETMDFFKNWKFKGQQKDVTVIRTDASGVEFGRTLLPSTECSKFTEPAYDASNPEYAKISVRLLPYDYIPISAE